MIMDTAVIQSQPQKMEQISETNKSDYTMLLIEQDHRHIDSSTPRYSGSHKTVEKNSRITVNTLNDRIADLSVTMSTNLPANTPNTHTPTSSIRSIFRKRHKSIGAQPPPITIANIGSSPTGYQGPPSAPIYGSKVRNLFNANKCKITRSGGDCETSYNKNRLTMDIAIDIEDDMPPSRHDTGYGSFPTAILTSSSPPPFNIYEARQSYGTRNPQYGGSYQRPSDLGPAYPSCMVGSVGPSDFVEMFRSRAYSETGLPEHIKKLRQHRASIGSITSQNSANHTSDYSYCPYEARQVIIWRDQIHGTQVFRLPSTEEDEILDITPSKEGAFDDYVYQRFLKSHSCYDVIPTSIKMVVLDTQLTVKKAFLALVANGITSAPLWETKAQDFIGMLTVTDFILLMLKCHENNQSIIEASEKNTLSHWADILLNGDRVTMLSIPADASLYDAVLVFERSNIHRLPVIDTQLGNIIYVLTPKCILRYMFLFFQHYNLPQPPCLRKTLKELDAFTSDNFATATASMTLVDALNLMVAKRISSLPIVDSQNKLVGLFHKNNVIAAVSDISFKDLNITIGQALDSKTNDRIITCLQSDRYADVIEKLVKNDTQQVIVVDKDRHVEAVINVVDILKNLVLMAEPRRSSSGRGSTSGGDQYDYFPMM